MLRDTFSQFQPDLWQVDGLVVAMKPKAAPSASKRKAERWKTATRVAAVTFAITSLLSAHASILPARSGAISNIIVKVESRIPAAMISGAEVPAGYWAVLTREISTWPRVVHDEVSDFDLEPLI